MNVQTYLFFDQNCAEAIEFYQEAVGAEVLYLAFYRDMPQFASRPDLGNLVFHATLGLGETKLNLSDDPNLDYGSFGGFVLLLHLDSVEAVDKSYAQLQVGGRVKMAPQSTPWAERFAIVTDRLGITWKLQH